MAIGFFRPLSWIGSWSTENVTKSAARDGFGVLMIILKLHLKLPFSRFDEALELFDSFLGPVLVHPGLISAGIYSGIEQGALMLLEEWRNREDMIQHLISNDFNKVMAVMDLAVEQPEIYFHTVSSKEGFELLETVRGVTRM